MASVLEGLEVRLRPDREWRGRVMGYFCLFVPEEIFSALGFLPYRVKPTGCQETPAADAHLSLYNCSFTRCCLEYALKGEFAFLDGLVSMNSCDHIRRLYDVWQRRVSLPFYHFLSVPHTRGEAALAWYRGEITSLVQSLERTFGTALTGDKLAEAIAVHNQTRALLWELYHLRRDDCPPLTGAEAHRVVVAGMGMDKRDYNRRLEALVEELRHRPGVSGYKARLMVVGSQCDDPDFIGLLEECGGLVVADALCFGSRYFWHPVPLEGDLLASLTKAYLSRPLCPRVADSQRERLEFILQMARDFRADGVVFQVMRNCDLWGGEAFHLRRRLEQAGLPCLPLEREYVLSGAGQLKSRVEAFVEMLEA